MNIGIDIDGVITNLENDILEYATKFCVENGLNIDIDLNEYDDMKEFSWSSEKSDKFWNEYWVKYILETRPRRYCSEIIKKLRNNGNKIFIITARDNYGIPKEYIGRSEELTINWLRKNDIEYDQIIFSPDSEKRNYCIKNNVEIMIEDSPKNILDISRELKVIKFNNTYNTKVENKNVIKAYSWYHIYDILKNI